MYGAFWVYALYVPRKPYSFPNVAYLEEETAKADAYKLNSDNTDVWLVRAIWVEPTIPT